VSPTPDPEAAAGCDAGRDGRSWHAGQSYCRTGPDDDKGTTGSIALVSCFGMPLRYHLPKRGVVRLQVRSETKTDRIGLIQLGNVFAAKVVDVLEKHIMFELSAHPQEIERFIDLCAPCAACSQPPHRFSPDPPTLVTSPYRDS
jgi:hypothetical protein